MIAALGRIASSAPIGLITEQVFDINLSQALAVGVAYVALWSLPSRREPFYVDELAIDRKSGI
jgi:hypothetical protein